MLGKVISQNGYISFISVFDVNMSHRNKSKSTKNRRKLDETENNAKDFHNHSQLKHDNNNNNNNNNTVIYDDLAIQVSEFALWTLTTWIELHTC